jgi:hypothetical protein
VDKEDGRAGRSAAWGIAALLFGTGAIAVWQVATSATSRLSIVPAYVLSAAALAALYMCFATVWGWRPTERRHDGLAIDTVGQERSDKHAGRDATPDLEARSKGPVGSSSAGGTVVPSPSRLVGVQPTGSASAGADADEELHTAVAELAMLLPPAEAPEPPLVTDRWLYGSWDPRASAAMNLLDFYMPGANHNQQSTEFLAWVRLLAVMKCSDVDPDLQGRQLWSWLEQFLSQPPVNSIVSALTPPAEGLQWTRWATSFASTVDGILTLGTEDEAVASVRLDLPDGKGHRIESDSAYLMLNFEPARTGGKPLHAFKPDAWDDLIRQALEISALLATYLSTDLSLAIPAQPPIVFAVRLDAATDLGELIDVTGLESLPGGRRRRQAIGYFLGTKDGSLPSDAVKRMVTDVLRYGFTIERLRPRNLIAQAHDARAAEVGLQTAGARADDSPSKAPYNCEARRGTRRGGRMIVPWSGVQPTQVPLPAIGDGCVYLHAASSPGLRGHRGLRLQNGCRCGARQPGGEHPASSSGLSASTCRTSAMSTW